MRPTVAWTDLVEVRDKLLLGRCTAIHLHPGHDVWFVTKTAVSSATAHLLPGTLAQRPNYAVDRHTGGSEQDASDARSGVRAPPVVVSRCCSLHSGKSVRLASESIQPITGAIALNGVGTGGGLRISGVVGNAIHHPGRRCGSPDEEDLHIKSDTRTVIMRKFTPVKTLITPQKDGQSR